MLEITSITINVPSISYQNLVHIDCYTRFIIAPVGNIAGISFWYTRFWFDKSAGPYSEQILSQLVGVGAQKNVPKKTKSYIVGINLFVCKKEV